MYFRTHTESFITWIDHFGVAMPDPESALLHRNVYKKGRFRAIARCRRLRTTYFSYVTAFTALSACLIAILFLVSNACMWWVNGREDLKSSSRRMLRDENHIETNASFEGGSNADGSRVSDLACTNRSIDDFPFQLFTLEQRQHGAVVVHVLVMAYMFAALGIVCDEYFMPALELTCEVLNLSEDVAGATFMAIGGSSPELFSSFIAVFIIRDDIGVGTIVGSAVFNIMCVIGLCGLLAGQVITLSCWPLTRDSFCYIMSILALVLVVRDGEVTWYDSVSLLAMYVMYCVLMYNNPTVESFVAKFAPSCCTPSHDDINKTESAQSHAQPHTNGRSELTRLMTESETETEEEMELVVSSNATPNGHVSMSNNVSNNNISEDKGVQVSLSSTSTGNEDNKTEEADEKKEVPSSPFELPEKGMARVARVITFPIVLIFYFTIPDCRKDRWERCFVMTFMSALLWIGLLTYVLVWMVTVIGDTLAIPDTIMGLTLLAAGASTPDTLLSLIAAREGYGDMAISHSIGSNLFDILVGLGLPWFLETVVFDRGSTVIIYSRAVKYIAMLLLGSVSVTFVLINVCRYRLGKSLGLILLTFYVIFVLISILFEMNVFIPGLALPMCH